MGFLGCQVCDNDFKAKEESRRSRSRATTSTTRNNMDCNVCAPHPCTLDPTNKRSKSAEVRAISRHLNLGQAIPVTGVSNGMAAPPSVPPVFSFEFFGDTNTCVTAMRRTAWGAGHLDKVESIILQYKVESIILQYYEK